MTKPGLEVGLDGNLVGRNPGKMSAEDLALLGHKPMPPLAAIRARCLDCCCYQKAEVRKCVFTGCASWPYRMGTNPWRARPSEAQRAASRRNASNLHPKVGNAVNGTGFGEALAGSAITLPGDGTND